MREHGDTVLDGHTQGQLVEMVWKLTLQAWGLQDESRPEPRLHGDEVVRPAPKTAAD